jgi:hypothetical protein
MPGVLLSGSTIGASDVVRRFALQSMLRRRPTLILVTHAACLRLCRCTGACTFTRRREIDENGPLWELQFEYTALFPVAAAQSIWGKHSNTFLSKWCT